MSAVIDSGVYGLVSVLTIQEILGLEVPVIGVGKITRMNDDLVVVDVLSKTIDGCVVERGINGGNGISLSLVHLNGVAILEQFYN